MGKCPPEFRSSTRVTSRKGCGDKTLDVLNLGRDERIKHGKDMCGPQFSLWNCGTVRSFAMASQGQWLVAVLEGLDVLEFAARVMAVDN